MHWSTLPFGELESAEVEAVPTDRERSDMTRSFAKQETKNL